MKEGSKTEDEEEAGRREYRRPKDNSLVWGGYGGRLEMENEGDIILKGGA